MTTRKNPSVDWSELTQALSQPFDARDVKYRVGAISRDKTKAQALPYADPRAYEDRLNALVPGAWEVEFQPWGDQRIICRLTIYGITRSSTGESGDGPDYVAGTSAEAQAFKRACTKFGLGRYLYAMESRWVGYDAAKKQLLLERTDGRPGGIPNVLPAPKQIGPVRAEKLRQTLLALGIPHRDHARLVSQAIRTHVPDLALLTEDQAARVWRSAQHRRASNARAQPSSSS